MWPNMRLKTGMDKFRARIYILVTTGDNIVDLIPYKRRLKETSFN